MIRRLSTLALAILGALIMNGTVHGHDSEPLEGKGQYSLFNPTPEERMRELSPDRPDATESPVTVDAGHFVLEVSVFDWRRNDGDDAYSVLSTNLKVGLTNRSDLQIVFDTYGWEDSGTGETLEGFGDIQLRLKYNLWGNDGGESALALFPYVKVPTGTELSNDEWEGGLIVPFSTQITERIALGLMAEFDILHNESSGSHEFSLLHSAVLGIDLTDRIGTFVEYIGVAGKSAYQSSAAGGFTFSVSDNLILDCGVELALNDEAEDLGAFFGFTRRF